MKPMNYPVLSLIFALFLLLCPAVVPGGVPSVVTSAPEIETAGATVPRVTTPLTPILRERLSAEEAETADRLDDFLKELFAASLLGNHAPFDVAAFPVKGDTPYGSSCLVFENRPIVDITVIGDVKKTAAWLKSLPGVTVTGIATCPAYSVVSAAIPASRLLEAAMAPNIRQLNASMAMTTRERMAAAASWMGEPENGAAREESRSSGPTLLSEGSAPNQAEQALDVEQCRRIYPGVYTGQGLRIGILSDSANVRDSNQDGVKGIAESQATGDLPDNSRIVIVEDLADGSDEGRAMMELIYDLAPGISTLGFATGGMGIANMAKNIDTLRLQGMNICVDDVAYLITPYFQEDIIGQKINDYVLNHGGLYLSSAGNSGIWGYRHSWSNAPPSTYHNFAINDEGLLITIPRKTKMRVVLQWTQPWGKATTDLAIELWDSGVTTLLAASDTNNINGNPVDYLEYTNPGDFDLPANLSLRLKSGSANGLTIWLMNWGRWQVGEYRDQFASTIIGHSQAEHGYAIGAAPYYNRDVAEEFSSRGSTIYYFDDGGNALNPPRQINKPDFLGIDGCDTSFFGGDIANDANTLPNFFGTSAAAPNVAGVAALVLQAAGGAGSLTAARLRTLLKKTAVDLGTAGFDTTYGYGRPHALGAITAVRGPRAREITLYPDPLGYCRVVDSLFGVRDIDSLDYAPQGTGSVKIIGSKIGASPLDPMLVVFDRAGNELLGAAYDVRTPFAVISNNAEFVFQSQLHSLYNILLLSETDFTNSQEYVLQIEGPPPSLIEAVSLNAQGQAYYDDALLLLPREMDYYSLTIPADATGSLSATLDDFSGFDVVLFLWDRFGGELARSSPSNGYGTPDTITYSGLKPGTHYIGVAAANYEGTGSYDLSISVPLCPGNLLVLDPLPAQAQFVVRPNPVTGSFLKETTLFQDENAVGLWVPGGSSCSVTGTSADPNDRINLALYKGSSLVDWKCAVAAGILNQSSNAGNQHHYRIHGRADEAFLPGSWFGIRVQSLFEESPPPSTNATLMEFLSDSGKPNMLFSNRWGNIQPRGKNEHFHFILPGNATGDGVRVEAGGNLNTLDLRVRVFNNAGVLLEDQNSAGSGENEITILDGLHPGERYHLLVTGSLDQNVPLSGDDTQIGSFSVFVFVPVIGASPTPSPSPTSSPSPTPQTHCVNLILDGGFETATPNDFWSEFSTGYETPLCHADLCGGHDGLGAFDGEWWAWMGQRGENQMGVMSLAQSVVIQPGTAALSFFLAVPARDAPPEDVLWVRMDDTILATFNSENGGAFSIYRPVELDVSAFADGTMHTLSFLSAVSGQGQIMFFLDEIRLENCSTEFSPTPTPSPSPTVSLTPTPSPTYNPCRELIFDGGFEDGSPSEAWREQCSLGLPIICNSMLCGEPPEGGAYEGDWMAWFGRGTQEEEESFVSQYFLLPPGSAELSFYLRIPVREGNVGDSFRILLDSVPLLTIPRKEFPEFYPYRYMTYDLSAFADGDFHTLRFEGIFGPADGETYIYVDNVSVISCQSELPTATPEPTSTPSLTPTSEPSLSPTATESPTPTTEPTATPAPTATASPSPDTTPTASQTPEPTPSPSGTPEPSATWEETPTPTESETPTPHPTDTPPPTETPNPSPTMDEPIDTDNDGYTDWYEAWEGTDPFDPNSHPSLGDVDGDGLIKTVDALLLYRYATGKLVDDNPPFLPDINLDGVINLDDARILYLWCIRAAGYECIPCP